MKGTLQLLDQELRKENFNDRKCFSLFCVASIREVRYLKGRTDKPCQSQPPINSDILESWSHLFAVVPLLSFLCQRLCFHYFPQSAVCFLGAAAYSLLQQSLFCFAILPFSFVAAFPFANFLLFSCAASCFTLPSAILAWGALLFERIGLLSSPPGLQKQITCFGCLVSKTRFTEDTFFKEEAVFFPPSLSSVVPCSSCKLRECSGA